MFLVTGATGRTGGATARALLGQGKKVRVLVRDRKKAESLAKAGAEVLEGNLADPASLDAACKDARGLLLVSTATPETPRLEGNVVDAAVRARVPRIVKVGAYGTSPSSPFNLARWHAEVERRIEAAPLVWTHLRPHYFMENFLLFHAATIRAEGRFYAPMRDGRIPMIDTEDVGAVAARCLVADGHASHAYDLTGPQALSHAECAATLSRVLGRPVAYVDVPAEAAANGMRAHGLPDWLVDGLTVLFGIYASGEASTVSPAVERVLGRPARSFEAFVRAHAAAFG
jgi:uncharacterized protein YbjT (DUF2867 family)